MGQQMSMTRKNRRKTYKKFNSQFFVNGNNTISHTFAVLDDQPHNELINVNSASENELLKVCDINLELAKNIVKHRKTIGYYQKVEDLVVVPGMGAERLDQIKHELCVTSRAAIRSSCQSFESLRSVDSRSTNTRTNRIVNVNSATIFELQLVHGITQEIAAGIVYHRNKKGPFKKLEDLRKVKCIDCIRLDNISRYLTVHNDEDITSDPEPESQLSDSSLNGYARGKDVTRKYGHTNGVTNGLLTSTLSDIFELLSTYSPRPIVKEIFRYTRNDKSAFRISSWNLENFTLEKASNFGVREVVCRTILENGWSILAIQNIDDEGALKLICEELNKPKLRRVLEWKYNRNQWKYHIKEAVNVKLGFIYDASGVKATSSEKGPPELTECCVTLITNFEIESTNLKILNLQVQSDSEDSVLRNYLQKLINSDPSCLICGDFGYSISNTDFIDLANSKLLLSSVNASTNAHSINNIPKYCSSNFLLNSTIQHHYTGLNGIVRQGLTHLAIPSGWSWGGAVSSFCPIWAEFFVHSQHNL